MQLGFAVNLEKEGVAAHREDLMREARENGYACAAFDRAEQLRHAAQTPDVLVVLGGDGSLLRFAAAAAELGLPILGVNLGRVGFLTEIPKSAFLSAIARIGRGDYRVEERMMLSCCAEGVPCAHCLNDILVFKHSFSGTVLVDVRCDDQLVGSVFCDGMLASTPTGSTAYNLSAGGPVVTQNLDSIAVTPVCSHTLYMRPVVSAPDSLWTFDVHSPGFVAADGVKMHELAAGGRVSVTGSDLRARFIRFGEQDVFSLIKQKLS